MSINRVILEGNVGKDPVVKYFDKSSVRASFPLATSEEYFNQQGETVTSTEWHNIVLWRALAIEAEKSIKKGSLVCVSGKIRTRSYVDKEGINKYITEIIGDSFHVYDKRAENRNDDSTMGERSGYRQQENSRQGGSVIRNDSSSEDPYNSFPEGTGSSPEDDLPF
ncbi:MAG: single-stranded DNA-binding protein [Bacteroidales bacterium]|jgi:single-strand DNA-binding protein